MRCVRVGVVGEEKDSINTCTIIIQARATYVNMHDVGNLGNRGINLFTCSIMRSKSK